MNRTAINPWPWSLQFGYNQAELIEGVRRQLTCAGQTAVDGDGAPRHPDDMRGQMALALDNLEAVLISAGMGWANVTRLAVYSTDIDQSLRHFDLFGTRLGPAGVSPPMTLIGVTRLAIASLMVEIEATAAD
jgi:enamine deaminase RidA (YjgF/YER057c/UK114 family)